MGVKLVSKEIRESLKKEYGNKLKSLILPLDDNNVEELEVLVVVPSRAAVGQSMKYMQTDPKRGQEVLIKACLLTSKEEVMNDDGLFYAAAGLLAELIPIRQGKFGQV